ncbi:MAG: glycosyltransferase family 4 protein [Armatimonadetes bacterium]|nr:glycosyltransferase family 4 protein [Armatimonadota bacterium]
MVLLLALRYPPPVVGGSYRYLWNLLRFLPPDRWPRVLSQDSVTPATVAADAAHPGRIERLGMLTAEEAWIGLGKIGLTFPWFRAAWRCARQHRPGAVMADSLTHGGLAAWMVSVCTGLPLLAVVYGEELSASRRYRNPLKRWLKHLFIRLILRRARGVLGVSDFTLDLARYYGARPQALFKIPPPVGEDFALPTELSPDYRAWRARKSLILLQTGRLTRRKGHHLVLACLPELLREFAELGYVIVGRGEEREALGQQVADLGLQDAVYFTGGVNEGELAAHYADADLFTMPHHELPDGDTEGCPTVFLEAAAFGLAVVGGDAAGAADAIVHGETGLMVPAENISLLRDALARLLRDPALRARMGEAGRARVQAEFRAEEASARFLQWCEQIVAWSPPGV